MARTAGAPPMIGRTLCHYRVEEKIGAGGMGEVYRARDTKLARDVAIKLLPDALARDSARVARFEHEARLLAAVNHPNIAAIYGLEESDGIRFLVLELVPGETMAERLCRGALPVEEALTVCGQIAEALEAAHEKGILHRDLKPGNIKVTPEGKVKVLDFGLAKALGKERDAADLSQSPTASYATGTQGVILGTAAYMSPEQARGKLLDRRTDIWSFGCVLYESLTGKQAFGGETVSDTIAKILSREPDWSALPASLPANIRAMLRRCLNKDLNRRIRDISHGRIELEESLALPATAWPVTEAEQGPRWRHALPWVLAGLFATLALVSALLPKRAPEPRPRPVALSTIELPANAQLALGSHVAAIGYNSPVVALSPDGAYLAYLAKTPSGTTVYLREMASGEIHPISGTEGAIYSFFSPDNQWIGFLTNDKVKKVPLYGGSAITLCEARIPVLAWWPNGDFIYFTENETWRITRIPSEGGKPEVVLDNTKVRVISFTDVLPDGKSVLAVSFGGIGGDYLDIVLVNAETLATRILVRSGYGARYVPPGYLFFARAGNLMAVPFEADRKEVTGEPILVAAGAAMESLFFRVHASYSHNGVMAFVPGGDLSVGKLAWVDRSGKVEYLDVPARVYGLVDLAPDGKKLAVHVADVKDYVWIYDIQQREGRRLPSAESIGWPLWSPDGQQIAVHPPASPQGHTVLVRNAEGDRAIGQPLNLPPGIGSANSWSPKDNVLATYNFDGTWHIGFLTLGKTAVPPGLDGLLPSFSPDGRWLAYTSHKTGVSEVFIRSYPEGKVDRQVSVEGGLEPRWKSSGELFYRNGDRWFSTRVSTQPELRWDPPRLAFETDFIDTPGTSYDVSPDGRRLLVVKRAEPTSQSKLMILMNWPDALRRGRKD